MMRAWRETVALY